MFKCERCQEMTKPGERLQLRVAKVRTVHYLRSNNTSIGQETVQEHQLCTDCNKVLAETPPETVGKKYIEFPRKQEEAEKPKSELPSDTIMAGWPRNHGRMKKKLRRERMRARSEEME